MDFGGGGSGVPSYQSVVMDKGKGLSMGFEAYVDVISKNVQGLAEVGGKGQRIHDESSLPGKKTNQ